MTKFPWADKMTLEEKLEVFTVLDKEGEVPLTEKTEETEVHKILSLILELSNKHPGMSFSELIDHYVSDGTDWHISDFDLICQLSDELDKP